VINKIKPPALKLGGTIGIAAPASKPSPSAIALGVERLKKMGFKVVLGDCVRKTSRQGYLAAPDEERAKELNGMFADEEIDGIICARGGYGCLRLLPQLDYDLIRKHPKIFMGMSDIVSVLLAIHKKTGLVTFHGPWALAPVMTKYTQDELFRALTSIEPLGKVPSPTEGPFVQTIREGKAEGELNGGNLDLVIATIGTEYEIDLKGKLFFFEAASHRVWEIDRFLTHLSLAGKLETAAGFIAGPMKAVEPHERATQELALGSIEAPDFSFSGSVEEVLQERLSRFAVPSIYGISCGHTENQTVLPIGVRATLDGTERSLWITEPALVQ
jgi:muramoyltetrapeptide carboxypeptidase